MKFNKMEVTITLQQIEDYILNPTLNNENIFTPNGGKKMKFLDYVRRLGRVTRIHNHRDVITSSYKLHYNKQGVRLPYLHIKKILDLLPMREDYLVEFYFKMVELGYNIDIFYNIVTYYNDKITYKQVSRQEMVEKVQGVDRILEEVILPIDKEDLVILRYGLEGRV